MDSIQAPTVTSIVNIDVGNLQRKDPIQMSDESKPKPTCEDEELDDVEEASGRS